MLSAEFEAMIRDVSRSFARRLVQEAAMSEAKGPNMSRAWLDEMGAKLDAIVGQERQMNAQELIGRMCAAPLVIQYDEGDEIIHTDEHPFCSFDETCGCHSDPLLLAEVQQQVEAGILTDEEATRLVAGKQF